MVESAATASCKTGSCSGDTPALPQGLKVLQASPSGLLLSETAWSAASSRSDGYSLLANTDGRWDNIHTYIGLKSKISVSVLKLITDCFQ